MQESRKEMDPAKCDTPEAFSDATWEGFHQRWRQGAYRASFFHDMILADARRFQPKPALLDIGCGRGFDGEPGLQQSLAEAAGRYVAIEPDASIRLSECFTEVHRCALEEAPLAAASIDLAFAVFVVEHLRTPQSFFDKLIEILVPGGVFWGFTVDLRHAFALLSLAADRLGVKDWCLKNVGSAEVLRGPGHYRAFYRANTPNAIRRCASRFRCVRLMNLHQEGQFDAYLPRWARPGGRWLDRLAAALGLPGPMLVMRLAK
jgi:SAM-dependent methyltransferase